MTTDQKKLLVVDDEPTVLMSVSMMLQTKGYHVTECESGQGVLDLIEDDHFNFDCVILDYTLPKMNGMRILQRIRSEGHQVPVILFSGLEMEEINTKPYEHMPDATITKPFQFDTLFTKVETLTPGRE